MQVVNARGELYQFAYGTTSSEHWSLLNSYHTHTATMLTTLALLLICLVASVMASTQPLTIQDCAPKYGLDKAQVSGPQLV